jgi:uncharacterized membrane protein
MSALACARWYLWSYGSDTGTFSQVIINVPRGFTDTLELGGTHFRTHWSPLLAVLWPLVALTRSPLSIQIVQVILIALCAVPLYGIVAARAGEAWGLRCAVLALIYPPLLANAFAEFHELAFFPVLTLTLVWAAERQRWTWFSIIAIAIVLIREDACVDLAIIGVSLSVVAAIGRQKAAAAAWLSLAVLSAGSLAFYVGIVLPRVGPWTPSHFYEYSFAHGPLQTALSIFTRSAQLLHATATRGRLTYLLEAFVPLAVLPLLTRWTLLAVPAFAGILLSSDASVWRMGMHYVLLWAPWLVLAAAFALIELGRKSQRVAIVWWRTALAICVVFLIAFNPMHPAHYLRAEPYQHTAEALRAFACVPADAAVATHDEWFAHEALAYPHATVIPDRPETFRGYLVFAGDWQNPHFAQLLPEIYGAERSGLFRHVCGYGSVRVLFARPVSR